MWLFSARGGSYEQNVKVYIQMADINHKFSINASPDEVYTQLTTIDGLQGWWTRGARGKSQAGSTLQFHFGKRWHQMVRVVDQSPGRRVAWTCIAGSEDWVGTDIVFNLFHKEEGKTIVRFGHFGWPAHNDFFAECSYHWAIFMKSLKDFVETGKGNPHP